jgi:hypothetical protein
LEELIAYIFRNEGYAKQEAREQAEEIVLASCSLLGISFDPEEGGNMFLRNIGKIIPQYMASNPKTK